MTKRANRAAHPRTSARMCKALAVGLEAATGSARNDICQIASRRLRANVPAKTQRPAIAPETIVEGSGVFTYVLNP